jgi:hypothetical protein
MRGDPYTGGITTYRGITNASHLCPSLPPKPAIHEVIASWYGRRFAGRATTTGEPFDPHRLTAASITVPLGSVVKVGPKSKEPALGKSAHQRLRSLRARAQPRPFAPRRAKDRHHSPGSGAREYYHS